MLTMPKNMPVWACYAHFLRGLVGPEAEGSARAFHDDLRAKAAQHARLVILAGVEVRNNSIVGIR